jgi:uncharacterized protein YbaP (TraB family)
MCKKFSRVLLFLTFLATGLLAQNSVIWEVTGNNLTSASYLMGTLKFIGEKEYYLPANVPGLLRECSVFAIEDRVDHHAQHELNKALHFPKGQSLETLSPEVYAKTQTFFSTEFGIEKSVFNAKYSRLKPLAISMTMIRLSLGEKVRFYDIELLKLAKKNKLKTYSLETIEREAQALNAYPIQDQLIALTHSLDNFAALKEEFRKLMADYPKGALEEIFQYTLHPIEQNPQFIEEFYTKRNQEWLIKIKKMMASNPSFIAVGVSHLEGEKGLLELLKKEGYTLTPLPVE